MMDNPNCKTEIHRHNDTIIQGLNQQIFKAQTKFGRKKKLNKYELDIK